MNLLYQAYRYSAKFEVTVWDFAVEIGELRRANLNINDFRCLLASGYVEHAEEITQAGDNKRIFRPTGKHIFVDRTCFVLTEAGVELAAGFSGENCQATLTDNKEQNGSVESNGFHSSVPIPVGTPANGQPVEDLTDLKPHWDADRKELRLGKHLVKAFRWPSPNQQTILCAFQEEDWLAKIDDPLPPPSPTSVPNAACTTRSSV